MNNQTALVALTRGFEARIDVGDIDAIADRDWTAVQIGRFWVARSRCGVMMTRLLLNPPPGMVCDHINGDTLDNRRCNIRVCTNQQNSYNSRIRNRGSGSSIRFKGVQQRTKTGFFANIQGAGRSIIEGPFATQEEAALCYDFHARRLHGEFARLNFPDQTAAV